MTSDVSIQKNNSMFLSQVVRQKKERASEALHVDMECVVVMWCVWGKVYSLTCIHGCTGLVC